MLKNGPEQWRGFPSCLPTQTLVKMMSDRKHLVSAEVDKLLEAAKSSRNAARDRGEVVNQSVTEIVAELKQERRAPSL